LKKAIRELKLNEDLHWHSLRHTAATNLVNKGVPLPVVKQILGHSDINTTMIYVKTDLASLRDAVNRL
jgi:site-specific recombinase XerD